MTDEMRDLELDLEPRTESKGSFWDFLVPMHTDNFALALASGFVGGALREDPAEDLQSQAGTGTIGFHEEVPSWALKQGESGDRVILSFGRHGSAEPIKGSIEWLESPSRITEVKAAYFKDEASLANFVASYDAFPDVATCLVENKISWPVSDLEGGTPDLPTIPSDSEDRRPALDFYCGLSAGITRLLETNAHDGAISQYLLDPGQGLEQSARKLLLAFAPKASELDLDLWSAAMSALRARFGKKGFDRRDFLGGIEQRVKNLGPEAASWIRGCQKVIDAEMDIPSLADNEKIGRRAVLAIMLSHEPTGLKDLEDNLEAGPRVSALVTVAVYAFAGLARADESLKTPAGRMNAVLEIGESLLEGKPVELKTFTSRIASDLTRHEAITINGKTALARSIEPPAYLVMLKARIQEAGYKVELVKNSGQIGIRAGNSKSDVIMVEDCPRSTPVNPIVNLVLPLTKVGARLTFASLKKFMTGAWDNATTVALREIDDTHEVVAMASLPLATLDRDELNFHVERLLRTSADLGGKKKSPRRVKKSGA